MLLSCPSHCCRNLSPLLPRRCAPPFFFYPLSPVVSFRKFATYFQCTFSSEVSILAYCVKIFPLPPLISPSPSTPPSNLIISPLHHLASAIPSGLCGLPLTNEFHPFSSATANSVRPFALVTGLLPPPASEIRLRAVPAV